MKLYHGTNQSSAIRICNNGIDLGFSQKYLDFGPGFYATPSYEHAAITALRKTDKINRRYHTDEDAYVVQFEYFPVKGLNCITFPRHSRNWGEFVLNNRLTPNVLFSYDITYHNQDARYDICIGEIADGSIVNVAYRVNAGDLLLDNVSYTQFLKGNGNVYPLQYSFHSMKAVSCIKNISCDIIHNKDKYLRMINQGQKGVRRYD